MYILFGNWSGREANQSKISFKTFLKGFINTTVGAELRVVSLCHFIAPHFSAGHSISTMGGPEGRGPGDGNSLNVCLSQHLR